MEKIFNYKRTYITRDGEEHVNLFLPVINIDDINVNGYIRVNQDCKGRIDKFVYSNVSKDYNSIDLLMYANNIYNPFSIDEGDILYTPIYNEKLYTKSDEPVLPDQSTLSSKNEKYLTYAEQVSLLAKQGKGWV